MPESRRHAIALWRERAIIVTGLGVVTALAWTYMARLHLGPGAVHAQLSRASTNAWGPRELVFVAVVWSVMMIGMMLPSASPMLMTFAAISRRRLRAERLASTAMFGLGYVLVWIGYSLVASVVQWMLHAAAMMSPAGVIASPYLAGGLLLLAGAFQLTPLKYACLEKCRSPMAFILTEWRPGPKGALVMGLRHGANCVACCWALMALMLVLGVLNLWWMLALTVFALIEKIAPAPVWTGRVAGVALVGWGVFALLVA